MNRSVPVILAMILLLLASCRRPPEENDFVEAAAPPPAAALAPIGAGAGLAEQLAALDGVLVEALEARDGETMYAHLTRAEAITDRLLERRPPATWLEEGYYLDSRLRQLQTAADRIVALTRRGAARERVLEDTQKLREDAAAVRESLLAGRVTEAPASLDSLLRDTLAAVRGLGDVFGEAATGPGGQPTPEEPARRGPPLLGTPVDPGT